MKVVPISPVGPVTAKVNGRVVTGRTLEADEDRCGKVIESHATDAYRGGTRERRWSEGEFFQDA
jgi:hypothetical protein